MVKLLNKRKLSLLKEIFLGSQDKIYLQIVKKIFLTYKQKEIFMNSKI